MKITVKENQFLVMYHNQNEMPKAEIIPAGSLADLWRKINWLMCHNAEFQPTHIVLPDGRRMVFNDMAFHHCFDHGGISKKQLMADFVENNLLYVTIKDFIFSKERLAFESAIN